jgi:hypothetical protein
MSIGLVIALLCAPLHPMLPSSSLYLLAAFPAPLLIWISLCVVRYQFIYRSLQKPGCRLHWITSQLGEIQSTKLHPELQS